MNHLFLSSMLSVFLLATGFGRAFADKQEHVDYLVRRIDHTLQQSLHSEKWRTSYKVAAWNIADLRRTLEQGGQLKSNPVKAFQQKLAKMIQERELVLKTLAEAEESLNKYPGRTKARLMINISAKLFKVLNLIFEQNPGSVDVSDMKHIKRDFKSLKTRAEARTKIRKMRNKILPALDKLRKRYVALTPLVAAYAKLPGAHGLAAAGLKRAAARLRQALARQKLQSQRPIKPKGRHWNLVRTITWVDPHINDHECYQTSLSLADGTFTFNELKNKCNKPYYSYTVSGTWSKPPGFLIPGKKYPMSARLSGKFTVSGNGYLNVYSDVADTKCGGSTRRSTDISGAMRIGWNSKHSANWTGAFSAPRESYGNAQGQFQIKAATKSGCVRYIYQWAND